MLTVSESSLKAFQDDARRRVREILLSHWLHELPTSGGIVGPEGREQVLREMEGFASGNPEADLADLVTIADMRLVDLANEIRAARMVVRH